MTSNWPRILTKDFEIYSSCFFKAVPIITAPLSAVKHFFSCLFLLLPIIALLKYKSILLIPAAACAGLWLLCSCICYSTITYFSEAGEVIFSQCVWLCFITVVFHLSSSSTVSHFPVAEWTGETLWEAVHTFSASLCFLCSFLSVFAPCRYSMPTYLFPRILFLPGHIGHGEAKRRPCSAAQHGVFGVQMQR